MDKFLLDGAWKLYAISGEEHPILQPGDLAGCGVQGIDAQVPGNVELDLQRAGAPIPGLQPHPYHGSNIQELRRLESYDWWYEKEFELHELSLAGRIEIVFEGVDTLATIWINGENVGEMDNMLIPHRFDVTDYLSRSGKNHIFIHIRSAVNEARKFTYEPSMMSWEHRFEGLFLRKAPHMWGWDIMPRAVSAGIWRSVYLQEIPENRFDWIYYWTSAVLPSGADLGVRFAVRTGNFDPAQLTMKFHGVCGEHEFEYEYPMEFVVDGCTIPIDGARLWWPAGYGEANLYQIKAQLFHRGNLLVERVDQIGIRLVEIERTETAGQTWAPQALQGEVARFDRQTLMDSHFLIKVNHEPVMVKGTNWVPLDAYHSQDRLRLDEAVGMVEELGCNMIRCWGGNVYESDAFFDWCDRHGILVWQDFAFACNIYPQTEEFLLRVKAEAEETVIRLRNHTCLAVWCGDNEIDMAYLSDRRDPGLNRLTREVLPGVVERLDPHTSYLPSSPYVPPSLVKAGNAWQQTPEQHLWGPRGYFKNPFYTNHSAHFIGEIGYHGCPDVASIRKFIPQESLWPALGNDDWQVHAVYHWLHKAFDRDRIQLMFNQVREFFGFMPEDLITLAQASQIVQAEAKKYFIESTRMRKWITSGILWWNLIDGWPQFSDAIVDYYYARKLAYEYIRRVQVPVCVMIGEPGSGKYLPVVIGNDSLKDQHVRYRVQDADDGSEVAAGDFMVPRNQNWQVSRIRTFSGEKRLFLIKWVIEDQQFGNHYLAGTPPFDFAQYTGWLKKISRLPKEINLRGLNLD